MPYKLKIGLITVVAILCIATFGATIYALLIAELPPSSVTFVLMLATAAGGLYCLVEAGRILSKEVEDAEDERIMTNRREPPPSVRKAALPHETAERLDGFIAHLQTVGHGIADAIKSGTELRLHMADVATHLDDTAAENFRLKQEEAKVREAQRILGRKVDDGAAPPEFLRQQQPVGALEEEMQQYIPRGRLPREDVEVRQEDARADGPEGQRDPSPRPAV